LDGTLILNLNQLDSGTTLTAAYTRQIGKPSLIVVLENGIDLVTFEAWLDDIVFPPEMRTSRTTPSLRATPP
jgi:hypothetical protein